MTSGIMDDPRYGDLFSYNYCIYFVFILFYTGIQAYLNLCVIDTKFSLQFQISIATNDQNYTCFEVYSGLDVMSK